MTLYRHHRSSLEDSMATVVTLKSRLDLQQELKKTYCPGGCGRSHSVMMKFQGADCRTGWTRTYIVLLDGDAVGFTDGPL